MLADEAPTSSADEVYCMSVSNESKDTEPKKRHFSVFNNVTDVKPIGVIDTDRLYHMIKSGGKDGRIRDGIISLRGQGEAERKRTKQRLPVITTSGVFSHRATEGLTTHNGYIQVDIDYKGNEERIDAMGGAVACRDIVSEYSAALLACISPSGTGVKLIVAIDLASVAEFMPPPKTTIAHELLAQTVAADFLERFWLQVDTAGGRLSQPMIIPYDENAFFSAEPPPTKLSNNIFSKYVDGLMGKADRAAAAELLAKAEAATNRNTQGGGGGKFNYYRTAVDNVVRRLYSAPNGQKHDEAKLACIQLHSLVLGARYFLIDISDAHGAFLAAFTGIGATEREAEGMWQWYANIDIEPFLPKDYTGWVGKIVSVKGRGAWRVLEAWQRANGSITLKLENKIEVPAACCQELGR